MSHSPLIVGLGGTLARGSSSERVLRRVLAHCEEFGAETRAFCGPDLAFPHYDPGARERSPGASALIEAIGSADGLVICSPSYHGTISGLLKNALDYVEDLSQGDKPYFTDRPVGLIAVAGGWQGTGSTLAALRSIVHALRGWPTPLGIGINSVAQPVDATGAIPGASGNDALRALAEQVVRFSALSLAQPAQACAIP